MTKNYRLHGFCVMWADEHGLNCCFHLGDISLSRADRSLLPTRTQSPEPLAAINTMKIGVPIQIILLFLIAMSSYAQDSSRLLNVKRMSIDSICKLIDIDKNLSRGIAEGNSKGEDGFDFNFYFFREFNSKRIVKIEYNLYNDNFTKKIFYYKNDRLIKIVNDNKEYILVNDKLYDKQNELVTGLLTKELIDLQNDFRKSIRTQK